MGSGIYGTGQEALSRLKAQLFIQGLPISECLGMGGLQAAQQRHGGVPGHRANHCVIRWVMRTRSRLWGLARRKAAWIVPSPERLALKVMPERAITVPMKQILLVDDEPNFLHVMARHFRPYRQEWTLVTTGNGKEALALIRKQPFDLVITDILMPEKDGLETIRELRKTHHRIQIIAISGGGRLVGTDMLQCARWLGAHQTLEKPFDPQILVNMVRALLTTPSNKIPAPLSGHETNPVCR